MRVKGRHALLGLALASLGLVGVCHERIVRWQVEKRLPGVGFDAVEVGLGGLTLRRVTFDRGWVRGELDRVTSDFEGRNVAVTGGTVVADLDARPPTDGGRGDRRIEFRGLSVRVTRGSHAVQLSDARSDGDSVCFLGARSEDPPVATTAGCYDKVGKTVKVEEATLKEATRGGVKVEGLVARKVFVALEEQTASAASVAADVSYEDHRLRVEATDLSVHRREGTLAADVVTVRHPWLAARPVSFEDASLQLGDELRVTVGRSSVRVEPKELKVSGEGGCDDWLDALPSELRPPPLDAVRMSGEVKFSVSLRPQPKLTLTSTCKATCSTMPNLRKPFQYTAYTPKGEPFKRDVVRGAKDWSSLGSTGDMPLAVTTMEDPGFQRHRGFILQAFSNSLADNVRHGKFMRGGSTITMQLVKNLWLTREKTLGRKLQEFFLAQGVESCYTKDDIMELYLNVVEFGPNRYGVTSGARHWFNKHPGELNPTEAFWLASILPRPSKTAPPGPESLSRVEALIKKLAAEGKVPDYILLDITDEVVDDE